jgi:thymidylate synthase
VLAFPQLQVRKAESLFDYTFEDLSVIGYEHHPALPAPVAV